MAVRIQIHDQAFMQALRSATSTGLRRAAVFYHRQAKQAVNKSNRRGTEPSVAGESPRKRTGFGQRGIVWEYNGLEHDPAVRVGITANAIYMLHLELGTRARIITPKRGGFLKIPWRGQGTPSDDEIKALGLKKLPPDGTGQRWWYFRKRVRQRGIAPRPWLLKSLLDNRDMIARLACTGGPPSLRS